MWITIKNFLFFYFIFILYFLLKMDETTYYQKSRKTILNSPKIIMKITKKY